MNIHDLLVSGIFHYMLKSEILKTVDAHFSFADMGFQKLEHGTKKRHHTASTKKQTSKNTYGQFRSNQERNAQLRASAQAC